MSTNTQVDMAGKTVMITGANSGIGRATAMSIAGMGADVVMICRDRDRGEQAMQDIAAQGDGSVELLIADLSSQKQIRQVAAEFLSEGRPLHVLVNNAGVTLNNRSETEDGVESTFAINHIGPFLLTDLLLDVLKENAPSRIVTVSSSAHMMGGLDFEDINSENKYGGMRVYGKSKLANILFTSELARRLEGTGVTANAAHPGPVASNFGRNNDGPMRMMVKMMAPFIRSTERGAETSIYLATSPEVEGITGKYFFNSKEKQPSKAARSDEDAQRLWQISADMTLVSG
ncbi:MAG: SDR family oxidoreductase [Acidimicrobiia bacterium]|nr:MAG: SDR family oxidoreductase [Acidimicrobiia bacterium]